MKRRSGALFGLLGSRGTILLDGALAGELERRDYALRDALWSARALWEAPELIMAIHLDYFRAGADMAITATYQASVPGFRRLGLSREEAEGLIVRATQLAREARAVYLAETNRPGPLLIAASVGPYGAYLADGSEYSGQYGLPAASLRDFHLPRLELLCDSGADLLALETQPSLAEAELLLQLLEELDGPPCYLSMSCRNGRETCAGDPIEAVARLAESVGFVEAVGVNCTRPQHVEGLLRRMQPFTSKPLLAYPNSGEGWDPVSRCWTGMSGWRDPAGLAKAWLAAGARILGGCCRTGPEDIAALRQALDSAS